MKALPLKNYEDINRIKEELKMGNVLIVKITPLAMKSIEEVKNAIDELKIYTQSINGDIARLGEERIVITPPSIKIWRRKTT
ncbi:cell division protein SepF [Candidatus Bathyarchaeota archaeon]|nr:MAG: cell division protein SepF [Candidatus Bathyarchaeota archaeon]